LATTVASSLTKKPAAKSFANGRTHSESAARVSAPKPMLALFSSASPVAGLVAWKVSNSNEVFSRVSAVSSVHSASVSGRKAALLTVEPGRLAEQKVRP